MQLYPRILVNLLVILVNVLVNSLVKLAQLRVRGGHRGSGSGEYTRERLVRLADSPPGGPWALGQPPKGETIDETIDETIMGLLLGIIAGIARNITDITRFARIY